LSAGFLVGQGWRHGVTRMREGRGHYC
jgi:hypothetical protein